MGFEQAHDFIANLLRLFYRFGIIEHRSLFVSCPLY